MSAAVGVVDLVDAVIAENYDPGAIARGQGYADDGRVRLISREPGRLSSVVAGAGRNTYLVNVAWRSLGGGIVIDDNCSCPLGGFCKHAVATILVAREEAESLAEVIPLRGTWRDALAEVVADDDDGLGPVRAELALEFTVSEPRSGRFATDTGPRLAVRPMRPGKRGGWIKTGASWRDLAYATGSAGLVPEHVAALNGLWNASPRHSYYPDTGPITLGTFGPELWLHLRNVADAGVAFIDGSGRPTVSLSSEAAHVEMDLSADESGAAVVRSRLVRGDESLVLDSGKVGVLGRPPHGLFRRSGESLELIALAKILTPALARLIAGPQIVIPAGDVDEFVEVYQPLLARHARVGSADGSVSVSGPVFVGLTLEVQRRRVDLVATRWLARYERGGVVTRRGWTEAGGGARDFPAEAASVRALAVPDEVARLVGVPAVGGAMTGPAGLVTERAEVSGADVVGVFTLAVPWLQEHGVEVVVTEPAEGGEAVPELREATGDPLVELAVGDAPATDGRTDWFDLSVSVSVEGEAIPFAALFRALSAEEPVVILPSGTWLRVDRPEFTRLRALIEEARGLVEASDDEATVRINRFQTSWFAELAALGVIAAQSDRWSAALVRMDALAAPEPLDPPATLKAELRPYQAEGLAWLGFIEANDLGGILADDMGLGKTVQILSLLLRILEDRPDARFCVVAPTSVVENWHREAERFAPTMAVCTVTETAKRRGASLADAVADASLVVTSYTLFRLEYDDYAALDWDVLCLDEAQFVKNHTGKTYRAVRQLPARVKLAITGTPLENSLMDLWSLLSIVAPGLYPDPERFSSVYRKPIEKGEAPELLATLRRRIAPLMRRRTKAAVLTDLPPKIEQVVDVELSAKHRRIYQTRLQRERSKVLDLVGDMNQNRFTIFKSLTLLRQLSLDPGLVDDADDHVGSAKLDRLVEDVTQIAAEGHRALVFSQFTRFLRRAEARLGRAGVTTAYLDGRTRRRAEVIDGFKAGDAQVFLISLKAGGVGLNLAEADYCFILDPWWNPAAESQAVDRAHRIGQVNPVVVYRYVATGTIEEKVMELKARKAALFSDVMDADGSLSGALSADDIRGLFELA